MGAPINGYQAYNPLNLAPSNIIWWSMQCSRLVSVRAWGAGTALAFDMCLSWAKIRNWAACCMHALINPCWPDNPDLIIISHGRKSWSSAGLYTYNYSGKISGQNKLFCIQSGFQDMGTWFYPVRISGQYFIQSGFQDIVYPVRISEHYLFSQDFRTTAFMTEISGWLKYFNINPEILTE